jgi:protein-disulfide isomerase
MAAEVISIGRCAAFIVGRCRVVSAVGLAGLVLSPSVAYAAATPLPITDIADVASQASAAARPDPPVKARMVRGHPRHQTHPRHSKPEAIAQELSGIPQSGNTLGDSNAPVTLQYFADLECPICRMFDLSALPELVRRYVRAGKLKIEYRSLETATREPEVFQTQQVAALAAGKQNLMWYFVELFYHEQGEEGSGYVTESYLENLAQQVPGLNLATWTSDRNDPALANQVTSDAQAPNKEGFTGTPSFLIGRKGRRLHELEPDSYTEPGPFEAAIKRLLRAA